MEDILGIIVLVGARSSGSAVAQTPAQAQQRTGSEIRSVYVGNTAYIAGRFGPKTIAVYFAPDGQIKTRSPDGGDTGTYRITEDGM